jgi:hypothetical protein
MAFIRAKKHGDSTYYYLVESKRVDGRVKQTTVAYMAKCPTIEEAYQYWKKIASCSSPLEESAPSEIASLRAYLYRDALRRYRSTDVLQEERQRQEAKARHAKARRKQRKEAEQQQANAEFAHWWTERLGRIAGKPITARENALRILGLSLESTAEQVKSAYRRLAKEHHPDVGGDAAAFRLVTEAYSLLTKP